MYFISIFWNFEFSIFVFIFKNKINKLNFANGGHREADMSYNKIIDSIYAWGMDNEES